MGGQPPAALDCAARLRVLAETHRLEVLRELLERPATVGELVERLDVEQTLLSYHLRALREARIVDTERDGKHIRYRVADGLRPFHGSRSLDLGCCRLDFAVECC